MALAFPVRGEYINLDALPHSCFADGKSDCSKCSNPICKTDCNTVCAVPVLLQAHFRRALTQYPYFAARDPNSCGYDTPAYTRVHRDTVSATCLSQSTASFACIVLDLRIAGNYCGDSLVDAHVNYPL